jgi:protein-S-isoprenylcysteine O-methyltransferase Ste14
MRHAVEILIKIVPLLLTWLIWLWVLDLPPSSTVDLIILAGGMLLVFPLVWIGRMILDRQPTVSRAVRITTLVHYGVGILFGAAIIRAIVSREEWTGWTLPVPAGIGLLLVIITGAAFLLIVVNLALKGFGAPFAIALSSKLAVDWSYAWTRNPMVLAALAFLLSLGLWFQSALFILWVLILFAPALLFFVKVYEERELEIRFGESYLEYRSRTPMLFPRKPGG